MPTSPSLDLLTTSTLLALTACGVSDSVVNLGSDGRPGVDGGLTSSSADAGLDAGVEAGGPAVRPLLCAPRPSACGYPDETNTGPDKALVLTPSGPIDVRTNGAVISNVDVRGGGIAVNANDVVVRNVRILLGGGADAGTFAISITPGRKNVLIEDSVIAGLSPSDDIQMAIFDRASVGQVTIRRVNLYNCSQCITTVGATIVDSYIHDLSRPASHDVYHLCDGAGPLLRHNTLFNPFNTTSTVYLDPVAGSCGRVVVDDNLAAGGRHVLVLGRSPSSELRITNNRVARLYYPNGGNEAPQGGFAASDPGNVWSGNFWDDTGGVVLP